jgi:ribonuclease HI
VDRILNAARSAPWQAVGMCRAPPSRMAMDYDCAALLTAFGSRGKQRTHDGEHPVPVRPDVVTPITPEEVKSAILSNNPKACADDIGIDARILNIAARSELFVLRFAELLTHCMKEARMPGAWTSCTISPIPKPGRDPSVIANLRPIYLTTLLAKTADRVFDRRVRHVWTPHPHQFGFRKGVPISVVPLAIIGQAAAAIGTPNSGNATKRQGHRAILIAIDLSDAFPATPTRCIMDGYSADGVALPPDMLAAKVAMLSRRQLRVRSNGKYSEWDTVDDGSNQGFVSGPTDFSASSTTLLKRLDRWKRDRRESDREFAMVADDLAACVSGPEQGLFFAAKAFLAVVDAWATEYGFKISPKSDAMLITAKSSRPTAYQHALHCGGVVIQVKVSGWIRLLGYHIDAKLNFSEAVRQASAHHVEAWLALLPLMTRLSPMDRKIVYEAVAMCHIRRIAPLLLCHGDSVTHWRNLDIALGAAARMMFKTHATADTHACIGEAGLLDARGLAISETIHLRHKLRAADLPGDVPRRALAFLDRFRTEGPRPSPGTGVVVDRQPLAPSEMWVERHVEFKPEPDLTRGEKLRLQLKRTSEADKNAIKALANERLRLGIPDGAKVIYCDGSVLRPPSGSTNSPMGGGGAAVFFRHGLAATHVKRPAGAAACSFTAELVGLLGAVDLTPHIDVQPGETIYIITDSQSLISALAKGIARQHDLRVAKLWVAIADAVKQFECRFSFQFAFGHVKWAEADLADRHAKTAAETGASMVGPEWWVDLARKECGPALQLHLAKVMKDSLRAKVTKEQPGLLPTRWPKKEWSRTPQHCAAAVTLAQLRTNACAHVRGHLSNQPENCVRCGVVTTRNGDPTTGVRSMVEHMFLCRRVATQRRDLRIDGLQDLWTHPYRAMALVRLFWQAI